MITEQKEIRHVTLKHVVDVVDGSSFKTWIQWVFGGGVGEREWLLLYI